MSTITVGTKIKDLETNEFGYVTNVGTPDNENEIPGLNPHNFAVDFCYDAPDEHARILFAYSEEGTEFEIV